MSKELSRHKAGHKSDIAEIRQIIGLISVRSCLHNNAKHNSDRFRL